MRNDETEKSNVLLRAKDVAAAFGVCKATIYNWVNKGLLPPQVKISENVSAWPKNEIDTIIAARLAGHDDDLIRALVERFIIDRKTAILEV